MPKLTKQFIDSEIHLPAAGQRFFRDDDIRGFAVRVTPRSKSYILERRVNGANRRMTIGKCSSISLESAREQACIMLGDIARGNDPKTGQRFNTLKDITLREVLQKYLEVMPIRKDTQRQYHYSVNRHFADWLDMPITSITKDMVEQRHHELTVSPNRLGTSGHGRANVALKKLSSLINFASDRYGTEHEPLIKSNPVARLSRNRSWHRIHPRQSIIPDSKLKIWYRAVHTLQHEVARDFMIFLLLTGMRVGETTKLKWSYVDFKNKLLVVPRELTKSDREHRLPLSDFLVALLKKRHTFRNQSEWVFPSTRQKSKPLCGSAYILHRVREKSGVHFTFHDLRRTFLTTGERLEVPHYVLKRLVNHSVSNDITGQYLVMNIERLSVYMSRITDEFIGLLGVRDNDMRQWQPAKTSDLTEIIQLQIPLDDPRIL